MDKGKMQAILIMEDSQLGEKVTFFAQQNNETKLFVSGETSNIEIRNHYASHLNEKGYICEFLEH